MFNRLLFVGISAMALTILTLFIALVIGWHDGSLEGYDGIFSSWQPQPVTPQSVTGPADISASIFENPLGERDGSKSLGDGGNAAGR